MAPPFNAVVHEKSDGKVVNYNQTCTRVAGRIGHGREH